MDTSENVAEFPLRELTGAWRAVLATFSVAGIAIACYFVFQLRWRETPLYETTYYYMLLAIYLSIVFLVLPLAKVAGSAGRVRIFAVDVFLFLVSCTLCGFFAWQGMEITLGGWGYTAPAYMTACAIVLLLLIMEALRRTSGVSMTIVVGAFAVLPLVADYLPGSLRGTGLDFRTLANYHMMSSDSVLGIPLMTFGALLTGFMVFSVALGATGGGKFLLDTALSLAGHARGGAAKVAVIASGLFGSISGSAVANVATVGPLTIPAMKASGFSARFAGAIETCGSTGGILMPPVMGAVAFVMANMLGVPYLEVAAAAAIPSFLYFLTIFIQVDGHAAQHGIREMRTMQRPSLGAVMRQGWIYIAAFAVLIYALVFLKIESQAPYYATVVLLVLAQLRKGTRFTRASFVAFLVDSGVQLATLVSILAAVGMILGALSITGLGQAIPSILIGFADGNNLMLLVLGALASFVLGTGMTVTACYIFLVVVLAPTLVNQGFNDMSVHLFLMYWGILSCITPPVALAAYPAAIIANTSPNKVAMTAMRLATALYVLPFLFVYNPALVLQAPLPVIIHSTIAAIAGAIFLASAIQGYLIGFGNLECRVWFVSVAMRALFVIAGILLMMGQWKFYLFGAVALALAGGLIFTFGIHRRIAAASSDRVADAAPPIPEVKGES